MPSFHLGQKVLITRPVNTKHRGREATIINISTRTPQDVTSADKYLVRFQEGDEADFYDIQLVLAPELEKKGG